MPRSSLFKRLKKVCDFFARLKNATFFVKTSFQEKSRYARQKVRTGHFLMAINLITSGAFAPSRSPATQFSLSIAYFLPVCKRDGLCQGRLFFISCRAFLHRCRLCGQAAPVYDTRHFISIYASFENSPLSANAWFIGPRPLPRSSIAASAPDIYSFARRTDVFRS